MPMERYAAKIEGRKAQVFAQLPFKARRDGGSLAEDGVSCALCHQLIRVILGATESYTGLFQIDPPDAQGHREHRTVSDRRRPHPRHEDLDRGLRADAVGARP